jgi:hypothetical protein
MGASTMQKHNVHIYAIVRVTVRGVEAKNAPEAAKKATESADLNALLSKGDDQVYADQISDFLVDTLDGKGGVSKETVLDCNFDKVRT